jgi:hypothetical protein
MPDRSPAPIRHRIAAASHINTIGLDMPGLAFGQFPRNPQPGKLKWAACAADRPIKFTYHCGLLHIHLFPTALGFRRFRR